MEDEYTLAMRFLDSSGSFVHGFECGQIWERMKANQNIDYAPVHLANRKQLELICAHYGYEAHWTWIDNEWTGFKAAPIDVSSVLG